MLRPTFSDVTYLPSCDYPVVVPVQGVFFRGRKIYRIWEWRKVTSWPFIFFFPGGIRISLQAGSTYRVPAERADRGRSQPAGLPELQTVGGIKGKSFASSWFRVLPGKAAVLFFPLIGFVFQSLLSYVLDIAHLRYYYNVSLHALEIRVTGEFISSSGLLQSDPRGD